MRFPEEFDLYETLGVTAEASTEEIKRQYHKLARKYHPDVSPEPNAEEKFKRISIAYGALIDPTLRRMYDQYRTAPASACTVAGAPPPPPNGRPQSSWWIGFMEEVLADYLPYEYVHEQTPSFTQAALAALITRTGVLPGTAKWVGITILVFVSVPLLGLVVVMIIGLLLLASIGSSFLG